MPGLVAATRRSVWGTLVPALLLSACADVAANNPYDPAAPREVQARGSIAGEVRLLQFAAPEALARVQVELRSDEATLDTVGADREGRFTLNEVPAGDYSVHVALPGYGAERRSVTVPLGEDVALDPVSLLHDAFGPATVPFSGTARLEGAFDHAGTLVRVSLTDPVRPFAQALTDAAGRFSLPASPAETYAVAIERPGYRAPATDARWHYAPATGSFQDEAGRPFDLTLTPLLEGEIAVSLSFAPAWIPQGERRAMVRLLGPGLSPRREVAAGTAEVFGGLPPGTHIVQVDRAGFQAESVAVVISPDETRREVNLAVELMDLGAAGMDLNGVEVDLESLPPETLVAGANLAGADLRGQDLSGRDLHGAVLSHASLADADLSSANLESATLLGADLSGADLTGARCAGATFFGARLDEAELKGADLSGANLASAGLSGAVLGPCEADAGEPATLTGAHFDRATLVGAQMCRVEMPEAELGGANLREARLTDARLPGARLTLSDLTDTDLDGADLSGAEMVNAILLRTAARGANLSGANLAAAILDQARLGCRHRAGADCAFTTWIDGDNTLLAQANLAGAVISGAQFDGADLLGAVLRGATIGDADVPPAGQPRDCLLDGPPQGMSAPRWNNIYVRHGVYCGTTATSFARARLTDARWFGVAALHVDFHGADLRGLLVGDASFPSCLMDDTDFAPILFGGVDFGGVDLAGARIEAPALDTVGFRLAAFDGATLTDVRFDRADLSGTSFEGVTAHRQVLWGQSFANVWLSSTTFEITSVEAPVDFTHAILGPAFRVEVPDEGLTDLSGILACEGSAESFTPTPGSGAYVPVTFVTCP